MRVDGCEKMPMMGPNRTWVDSRGRAVKGRIGESKVKKRKGEAMKNGFYS